MNTRDLRKGSAELVLRALLEARPRHGYELARMIESGSANTLHFHVASIYPMLYRMEAKGWVLGRWVEKAGERRRRRFYRLTPLGRRVLAEQRRTWRDFVAALDRLAGLGRA
jgi:PadR family transcriptional regulator